MGMNISDMSSNLHLSSESEGSGDENSPRIHQTGKIKQEEFNSQKQTASKIHEVVTENIDPLIGKRLLGEKFLNKEEITRSVKKMNPLPPLELSHQDTPLKSSDKKIEEQEKTLEECDAKKTIQTTPTTTTSSTTQESMLPREQMASSSAQAQETEVIPVQGPQALSPALITRFEKLLSLSLPEALSVEKIAELIFKALQDHIENKVLTEEFIEEAHACLFNSELALYSQAYLHQEMSFIRPHAVAAIHSLANCLRALPQERDFFKITKQAETYTNEMRDIQRETKKKFFPIIKFFKKENDKESIDRVNHCPLYTANDWFSVSNKYPVFILRTEQFNPEWVFKPATLGEDFNESDIRDREHYAFKMNFHEQFPIPALFSIQFKGVSGTIQPFISNTVSFRDIPDEKVNSLLPALKKLLIFDLLFLNHDRNFSNILYRKEGDAYTCYGIDHEESLKCIKGAFMMEEIDIIKELSEKIDLKDFDESTKALYSEQYCKEYVRILNECFKSKDKLDQSEKYDFDIEGDEQMLAYIERVGGILRNPHKHFSQIIDEIPKIIKVITAEGGESSNGSNPSSPQPSSSFLTD